MVVVHRWDRAAKAATTETAEVTTVTEAADSKFSGWSGWTSWEHEHRLEDWKVLHSPPNWKPNQSDWATSAWNQKWGSDGWQQTETKWPSSSSSVKSWATWKWQKSAWAAWQEDERNTASAKDSSSLGSPRSPELPSSSFGYGPPYGGSPSSWDSCGEAWNSGPPGQLWRSIDSWDSGDDADLGLASGTWRSEDAGTKSCHADIGYHSAAPQEEDRTWAAVAANAVKHVKVSTVSASDYGLPQSRNRLYVESADQDVAQCLADSQALYRPTCSTELMHVSALVAAVEQHPLQSSKRVRYEKDGPSFCLTCKLVRKRNGHSNVRSYWGSKLCTYPGCALFNHQKVQERCSAAGIPEDRYEEFMEVQQFMGEGRTRNRA